MSNNCQTCIVNPLLATQQNDSNAAVSLGFYGAVYFYPSNDTNNQSAAGVSNYFTANGKKVLVSSFNMNAHQEMILQKPIDTNYFSSSFHTSNLSVGGSINMPVLFDSSDPTPASMLQMLWLAAIERDYTSGSTNTNLLANQFDILAKYNYTTYSTFYSCLINTLSLKIQQQSPLQLSLDMIGKDRAASTTPLLQPPSDSVNSTRNKRIANWSDCNIDLCFNGQSLNGCSVRAINLNVNNGIQPIYSLNGNVTAVALASTQRLVSGQLKLNGRNDYLSKLSYNNILGLNKALSGNFNNCHITGGIGLIINSCGIQSSQLKIGIPYLIFQIEQMDLNPQGIVESTIKYRSISGQTFSTQGYSGNCPFTVDKNFIAV